MVVEPTHKDEGLLDHLYLTRKFFVRKHVNSMVKNIYVYLYDYSAGKVYIQKENKEKIN